MHTASPAAGRFLEVSSVSFVDNDVDALEIAGPALGPQHRVETVFSKKIFNKDLITCSFYQFCS